MFLLNTTNYKYSNSYVYRNDHYDDSRKLWMSLVKRLLPKMISTKALMDFCGNFSEQKNKETELAELGILPKSGIS